MAKVLLYSIIFLIIEMGLWIIGVFFISTHCLSANFLGLACMIFAIYLGLVFVDKLYSIIKK